MADNTTLNAGTGGDVVASDDITGVKYQRVKVTLGADGVNDGDVASGNPLPVSGTVTANLAAGTNNIGDVDVLTLPALPAGTNNIGDVDVLTLPALPAGTNNIGDVDVLTLPSIPAGTNYIGKFRLTDGTSDVTIDTSHADASSNTDNHYDVGAYLMGYNGTTWDRLRSDTTNGLDVDVTRVTGTVTTADNQTIADNAGFTDGTSRVMMAGYAFDETAGTALTENDAAAARIDSKRAQVFVLEDGTTRGLRAGVVDETGASAVDAQAVGGGTPHDSVDSGNPVKMGCKAESSPATVTLVADGDRTEAYADIDGLQMVKPYTSYGDIKAERVTDTGGTSTAFSNFSAVASTRNYVTSISVYNSSGTGGFVDFRDGTAGTVLFTMAAPAGGGSTISFPVPLRQPTTNTALAYDVSGALTTVYISVVGFQSKG